MKYEDLDGEKNGRKTVKVITAASSKRAIQQRNDHHDLITNDGK